MRKVNAWLKRVPKYNRIYQRLSQNCLEKRLFKRDSKSLRRVYKTSEYSGRWLSLQFFGHLHLSSLKQALNSSRTDLFRRALLIFILFTTGVSQAQYYTGTNIGFGRKRVQYEDFFWMYYRFNGFDVYYNRNGKNLAFYTANYVQHYKKELEQSVGISSGTAYKFIIFNRISDYKQSNIGFLDENTTQQNAGSNKISGNKVFLIFNGDYVDFEKQIREGILSILLHELFNGSQLKAQYKNTYSGDFPEWFTKGLSAFLAQAWNADLQAKTLENIKKKKYKYISGLTGEEAKFAGHSFWNFVAQKYGYELVLSCIQMASAESNLEQIFKYGLNKSFDSIIKEWLNYYNEQCVLNERGNTLFYPDSNTSKSVLKKTNRTDRKYFQFVASPNGESTAFVSNEIGKARVEVYKKGSRKRKVIYKAGVSIDDQPDYTFPVLAWHPNGEILIFAAEHKGRTVLKMYDIKKKKKDIITYEIEAVDKVLSLSFSPDGKSLVMSATKNGQSDIFVYPIGAGGVKQITFDIYDDANPVFINLSQGDKSEREPTHIVFSSNRKNDSLSKKEKFEIAPSLPFNHELYMYDLKTGSTVLMKLTDALPSAGSLLKKHYSSPKVYRKNELVFMSNATGSKNLELGSFDYQIRSIDTAIHYQQTFDHKRISDFSPGLIGFDLNREVFAKQQYVNFKNYLTIQEPPNFKNLTTTVIPFDVKEPFNTNWGKSPKEEISADSTPAPIFVSKRIKQTRLDDIAEDLFHKFRANDDFMRALGVKSNLDSAGSKGVEDSVGTDGKDEAKSEGLENASDETEGVRDSTGMKENEGLGEQGEDRTEGSAISRAEGVDSNDIVKPSKDVIRIETELETSPSVGFSDEKNDSIAKAILLEKVYLSFGITKNSKLFLDSALPKISPKQKIYRVEYSLNEATAQLGFDFLNGSYQTFSGGGNPIYLNPGMTGITKFSMTDLMENHRIIGGFRFSFDFKNTEFLLSYENLTDRIGKQYIFHIQNNAQAYNFYSVKGNSYAAYYILRYPFSEVSMVKGTVFGRLDREVLRGPSYAALSTENYISSRLGLKGEYIFDATRSLSKNIAIGTKYKGWIEYYQGIGKTNDNIFVLGFDFRNYQRIFRQCIWANRVGLSTSFGKSRLIYYMGGVDNWILAKFNQDVKTDPEQNYAYQTLANNMRGFDQNIRNGNSFVVLNSEIRFPIFACFSKKPIRRSWVREFQVVAFGDVGSAWSGANPWDPNNQFYKKEIKEGPLTITLRKDANPFVGGFGGGLRTELFGYFVRFDMAWGVENGVVGKQMYYLSFTYDF